MIRHPWSVIRGFQNSNSDQSIWLNPWFGPRTYLVIPRDCHKKKFFHTKSNPKSGIWTSATECTLLYLTPSSRSVPIHCLKYYYFYKMLTKRLFIYYFYICVSNVWCHNYIQNSKLIPLVKKNHPKCGIQTHGYKATVWEFRVTSDTSMMGLCNYAL